MYYLLSFIAPFTLLITTIFLINLIKKLSARLEKTELKGLSSFQIRFLRNCALAFVGLLGTIFTLSSIPALQNVAFSLLAGSGIIVTGIGFAAQSLFANMMSGFFLQAARPFAIGDIIRIENPSGSSKAEGKVEEITLCYTILRTEKQSRIFIPNSTLQTTIIENKGKNF